MIESPIVGFDKFTLSNREVYERHVYDHTWKLTLEEHGPVGEGSDITFTWTKDFRPAYITMEDKVCAIPDASTNSATCAITEDLEALETITFEFKDSLVYTKVDDSLQQGWTNLSLLETATINGDWSTSALVYTCTDLNYLSSENCGDVDQSNL